MNEKQLWDYFLDKQVVKTRPFDREFIWISRHDFEYVNNIFTREFNILHSGESFRSRGLFSHIHVVDQESYFFVHKDMGNLTRFFPLGLLHLVVDVVPYVWFSISRQVPIKSLFEKPD